MYRLEYHRLVAILGFVLRAVLVSYSMGILPLALNVKYLTATRLYGFVLDGQLSVSRSERGILRAVGEQQFLKCHIYSHAILSQGVDVIYEPQVVLALTETYAVGGCQCYFVVSDGYLTQ